jgi:catechol 2,3-dioxygenase-like lactoylglutathione lyase family enzyme
VKIDHIKLAPLPVEDQDRAIGFYTGHLGMKVLVDAPDAPDWRWVELAVPGAKTKLLLTRRAGPPAPGPVMVLIVADVAVAHAELAAAGVDFTQRPGPAPWDKRLSVVILRDSEGNLVELADG